MTIGTQFKIKGAGYSTQMLMTVTRIENGAIYYTAGKFGDGSLTTEQFDYYQDKKLLKIVFTPQFDAELMQTAQGQALNCAVLNVSDENGGRIFKAFEKADKVLATNKTLDFKDGVLSFISNFSHESRYVTAFGCDIACPCGNQFSYHTALYRIFDRYAKLVRSQKRTFVARGDVYTVFENKKVA